MSKSGNILVGGEQDLAVRAYNCGPTFTKKVRSGEYPEYPKETIIRAMAPASSWFFFIQTIKASMVYFLVCYTLQFCSCWLLLVHYLLKTCWVPKLLNGQYDRPAINLMKAVNSFRVTSISYTERALHLAIGPNTVILLPIRQADLHKTLWL